ncbi:hypothetical protein PTTG_00424 [Puccinia triticina 1-1 BBBD Race 1]|uniref:DDE Tnp4 domain-containing protein n=1 Tax=Puccinia triticina (isolate 1-1 / race 1 (BBBD)) TaxID=630390 RepID=A0A0C4EI58_PUCT1|nr:hypothetical protein PTTG_00424 [Puccinia triticina 1-1 BBBD Race 1]
MSLDDFRWLSDQLRPQDPLQQGDPLSVEAQVAVGLYWISHGATYVNIGHVFNIGKETTDKALGRFVKAVLRVVIAHWPAFNKPKQWASIKDSFKRLNGIPNLVGAIDGTHIPLAVPPHDEWKGYINRKSWTSIVFECVVDGDRNFRNVSWFFLASGPAFCHQRQARREQSQVVV